MTVRTSLGKLMPFLQKKGVSVQPRVVEVDREAFARRALQLWATDRNSDEAREVFRILENSRTPRRPNLKQVG